LAELPLHAAEGAGFAAELLVLDGDSTDRTVPIGAAWGARVLLQSGGGKGRAFRDALSAVHGDYIIMLDSDATYPADDILRFIDALELGADVVLGSRFQGSVLPGAMRPVNRIGNHLLSAAASLLFLRRTTDLCTGMWGFRHEALSRMPLTADHFELEAEFFALAVRLGMRIVEVPIEYRPRIGRTKLGGLGDGGRIAWTLMWERVRELPPVRHGGPAPRLAPWQTCGAAATP
jgi:dolichol-phosphate mannosyltransferase